MKTIKYCPYCGSEKIKFVKSVPRCTNCNRVFFVNFSRFYKPRNKQ